NKKCNNYAFPMHISYTLRDLLKKRYPNEYHRHWSESEDTRKQKIEKLRHKIVRNKRSLCWHVYNLLDSDADDEEDVALLQNYAPIIILTIVVLIIVFALAWIGVYHPTTRDWGNTSFLGYTRSTPNTPHSRSYPEKMPASPLEHASVGELKIFLDNFNIDYSTCLEKTCFIDLVKQNVKIFAKSNNDSFFFFFFEKLVSTFPGFINKYYQDKQRESFFEKTLLNVDPYPTDHIAYEVKKYWKIFKQ
ncbi:hypothetical protein RFI_05697, partial [Reticulomyxa filosa]